MQILKIVLSILTINMFLSANIKTNIKRITTTGIIYPNGFKEKMNNGNFNYIKTPIEKNSLQIKFKSQPQNKNIFLFFKDYQDYIKEVTKISKRKYLIEFNNLVMGEEELLKFEKKIKRKYKIQNIERLNK